jgi:hypothetical protein
MLPLSLKSTVKCHWCIFFKISKTFLFLRFWLDFFTQCTYKHLKTDYEQKYLDFGPKVPLRSPPPVYSTVHSVPHMYCIYCTTKNYNTVLVNISKSVFLSVCLSVCLPACLSVCLHKSLWPRSLTLHFELFWFWLRIRGDIRIRKTTPRIDESGSRQDCLEYPFFSNLWIILLW